MFALTWYTYTNGRKVEYFQSTRALQKRLAFLTLKGHLAFVEVL